MTAGATATDMSMMDQKCDADVGVTVDARGRQVGSAAWMKRGSRAGASRTRLPDHRVTEPMWAAHESGRGMGRRDNRPSSLKQ